MESQHSREWYRRRLGKITGSRVGDLMKLPRSKAAMFTDTAKSYIYQLAAEREMNSEIIDDEDLFEAYLNHVSVTTKAMKWGNDQEDVAREIYASNNADFIVSEVGLCTRERVDNFGSSPDGYVSTMDGELIGCIEIKCPNQNTFIKYGAEVKDSTSLKEVKPEYYWQCQSHMLVLDVNWCDFIAYCAWQSTPLRVVRITRNIDDQRAIIERVEAANDAIETILKNL